MADDDTAAAAADAEKVVPAPVDLDAGGWGDETFDLKHPFKFAQIEYASIAIRVPTGEDIYAYFSSTGADFRFLALRLTDFDDKLLGKMHGSDFSRLMGRMGEYVAGAR